MLELPESHAMAKQLNQTVQGKIISQVVANASPHGFAFYFGDPAGYPSLLQGKTIGESQAYGGQIEFFIEDMRLVLNDGVNLRFLQPGAKLPAKHQLLLNFTDGSALVCTVQMYGGLQAFPDGLNDNFYYLIARSKPSPLSLAFDKIYFNTLWQEAKPTLSAKAFLATEQRIPGLGNGILQDILFQARIHPKTKLNSLTANERSKMYQAVKTTLQAMAKQEGRDTEKDLFGNPGGYATLLSNKTWQQPCPVCGGVIIRQAYLGGNVYVCPHCQPLKNKSFHYF